MITIRNAVLEDASLIVDFQIKMALETEGIHLDPEIVNLGVMAVMKDSTKGVYYVAEEGGRPVGSLLTTFEWSDWRNSTILWIQSLYVTKKFRKKGIFKSMYRHLQSLVLGEGSKYAGIRLYVDKSNDAAQKVYQSLGMTDEHYSTFEWFKE